MYDYQLTTLPNGVRIASERMPGVRSAALGIWVSTGSRDEKASEGGAAHFIEHMLFKGTPTCSAEALARRMDAIGGQINAFTTKENTCFHARCLDTHLREALDILCDMFFDSAFAEADVATERGVILEEIGMYADDPSDLVSEKLFAAVFHGSSLGRPILGRKATLDKMTGSWLKAYKEGHYTADRVVITLAGSFDDAILEEIKARFSAMAPGKAKPLKPAAIQDSIVVKKKATEQNHLLVAFPSITDRDPRKYQMQLLSSILLELAREQSKANVLMGLEATSARMSHLARCLLREGKFLTPDDIIAAYDAVTREEVLQLARDTFDFEHVSFSAVGRVAAPEDYRKMLLA